MSDNHEERCGFAVVDRDGDEQPCDRPATGWRWYQDCDHEDALDVACDLHANEGGRRMAALSAEVAALRAERDGIDAAFARVSKANAESAAELAGLRQRVEALLSKAEARNSPARGGYVDIDAVRAALAAASPEPERPTKPCADCGHDVSVHHKLRCEAPEVNCYGCNGWTCPEHGLKLCGCTYLGGPVPSVAPEEQR